MATEHTRKAKRRHEESTNNRSKKQPLRRSIFGEIDKTKEYVICWLGDSSIEIQNYHEALKTKLRGIIDFLCKISNVNDIKQMMNENIYLVLDFETLVKHISQLSTLNQIHGLFNNLDELFLALSKNVRTMVFQSQITDELPSFTSASKTIERSTTLNYTYVTDWYISLIRAMENVPPARNCKEKFVEECRILYDDNPSVLRVIEEFNSTYVPEDAIRWYTRDGFVYKVLNRILREQNQQGIQLLHFLIYDLNQQLRNELRTREQTWLQAGEVHLYRGQLMSKEEVQQIRKNKGEQLFVNSFLSTTTDLAVAKLFSGAGTYGLDDSIQSVIFRIEWSELQPKQGVADIHHLSFNEDEGEILLSPTYTINFFDCKYDENKRGWNATFSRIENTEDPLIRITDDECLMKLELILRHLIEEKDPPDNEIEELSDTSFDIRDDRFEFSTRFCSTFVHDVPILMHELELPELCSVTLNDDDSGRFKLKALQSFTSDSLDHGPKIRDDMVVILYDSLGSAYKIKGKFMEAYYYYQKASTYDNPQSQTTYTRQANLAQIHKMNGDYELAWKLFNELMNRTEDMDNFLYEDIAFARSKNMSDSVFFENVYAFLQYSSTYYNNDDDDDDDDETSVLDTENLLYVIEAWAELGYRYFYHSHDCQQALNCYEHEKQLSSITSSSPSSCFNPLIGSCSERMGDIYVSLNETEKALILYQEALDLTSKGPFHINVMTAARCMCKIGHYSSQHQPKMFQQAFQYLIDGFGKSYTLDTIGKCYVCLSRSLQRCDQYELALKYAKQALSIFQPDPLLLEELIDDCCQLILELHRSLNNDNMSIVTKEDILKDRVPLNDEQILNVLQETFEELSSELDNP